MSAHKPRKATRKRAKCLNLSPDSQCLLLPTRGGWHTVISPSLAGKGARGSPRVSLPFPHHPKALDVWLGRVTQPWAVTGACGTSIPAPFDVSWKYSKIKWKSRFKSFTQILVSPESTLMKTLPVAVCEDKQHLSSPLFTAFTSQIPRHRWSFDWRSFCQNERKSSTVALQIY